MLSQIVQCSTTIIRCLISLSQSRLMHCWVPIRMLLIKDIILYPMNSLKIPSTTILQTEWTATQGRARSRLIMQVYLLVTCRFLTIIMATNLNKAQFAKTHQDLSVKKDNNLVWILPDSKMHIRRREQTAISLRIQVELRINQFLITDSTQKLISLP